uniref:G-protein coupled receptors family 2 profile 2 domain-containing protein n=1 Tax=Callorhinchus milii TaxID=7868 RepID=A0A4W3H2S8_CALMI
MGQRCQISHNLIEWRRRLKGLKGLLPAQSLSHSPQSRQVHLGTSSRRYTNVILLLLSLYQICQITAILLHYLFLTSFAWMMLEGVQLYLMVVKVFQSKILQSRILFSFGYGLSLLIVAITVATNHNAYGANNICWLSIENGFIWAFVGPVCAVVGSYECHIFRRFLCTAIAQLVVLGLTWILGFMHFNDQTIVMSYLFTIFNSFQGLFIFILHCVLNKQVGQTESVHYIVCLASLSTTWIYIAPSTLGFIQCLRALYSDGSQDLSCPLLSNLLISVTLSPPPSPGSTGFPFPRG